MLTAAIGRVQSLDQDKKSKDPGGAAHRGSQSFICAPMSALGLSRQFWPTQAMSAFPPKATKKADVPDWSLSANSCHMRRSKQHLYSITSSARASTDGGISRPSALAVLWLMTSSYLVGVCTGRSAGFSPLRMRST